MKGKEIDKIIRKLIREVQEISRKRENLLVEYNTKLELLNELEEYKEENQRKPKS